MMNFDETCRVIPRLLADRKARGRWVPAVGWTGEEYITPHGRRLLYVWHTGTCEHGWLDCDTAIVLSEHAAEHALRWRH